MTSKNKAFELKKGTNTAQPPQWTEYLCCSVCEKDFNHTDRCPISLGCGHTLCRACLGKLKQPQCQFDQIPITCNKFDLPSNSALLKLLPGESEKDSLPHIHVPQNSSHESSNVNHDFKNYENAKVCIEDLALFLKPGRTSDLSRPMQRKLVSLINCQLFESEGRKRALRASRALGERTATELILLHQNPTTLSSSLWAAVRARGCQFLGPAMQEEALKLIHLALEDGSELSRKVLVQIVVKNLQTQFSQASKTSIGHVVQLLYRASCFKVTKRDGESSLMRLKDEFLIYEELRKEHDSQIVQIAREAGLRIAPDQWSALLYGDQAHKSHMQSIIDRLQSGGSFQQCIADLSLALQRSNDPGNMQSLLLHFKFLLNLDTENPSWDDLEKSTYSAKVCIQELVEFTNHQHHWLWQCQDATQQTSKYKTSMCRDSKNKGICPRGQSCTFAHSEAELQHYRNRKKKSGQISFTSTEFNPRNEISGDNVHFTHTEKNPVSEVERSTNVSDLPQQAQTTCQCGNSMIQSYNNKPSLNYHENIQNNCGSVPRHPVSHPSIPLNMNQPTLPVPQQVTHMLPNSNLSHHSNQIQYVAGNQLVYETKPRSYDSVSVIQNEQNSIGQVMSIATVQIQNSSIDSSLHGNVIQPGQYLSPHQYLIHGQPTPSYCPIQPNQVQPVLQEPTIISPNHPFPVPPPPYPCVAVQNGSSMAVPPSVPPPRPGVLPPQPPLVYQQPSVQIPNLPPTQTINYQQRVFVPVVPPQPPTPNLVPPSVSAQSLRPNENLPSFNPSGMTSVVPMPCKEMPFIPKSVYDSYHVVVPSTVDGFTSLAELQHRKDEVISKLVKKRIVTPKAETNLQQKISMYCDIPIETSYEHPYYVKEKISNSHKHATNLRAVEMSNEIVTLPQKVNERFEITSNGHYSLWTGTTCIPSLEGLSFQGDIQDECQTGINVLSDLDSSTSQVSITLSENKYLSEYSICSVIQTPHLVSYHDSKSHNCSDDEIVSIQDQRIVSKYGPIARAVRSKTTPAIPEQVTANCSATTHPFPSDKNRNKSNFVAGEQNESSQNFLIFRSEVEPTAVSVDSKRLPDVVTNSNLCSPAQQNVRYDAVPNSSVLIPSDANEDLLLAIELQQIEMGIQRIQRDSK